MIIGAGVGVGIGVGVGVGVWVGVGRGNVVWACCGSLASGVPGLSHEVWLGLECACHAVCSSHRMLFFLGVGRDHACVQSLRLKAKIKVRVRVRVRVSVILGLGLGLR